MPRIVSWIVIVFFIVSSTCTPPVFADGKNGTCIRKVSRKVNRKTGGERASSDLKQLTNDLLQNEKTGTPPLPDYDMVWQDEKICCPRYEEKDGVCTPQCSTTCENGHCAEPNTCKCDNNWGGESCSKPLACVVIQTSHVNVSETVSEIPVQEGIEDAVEHPLSKWKGLPECLPECLEQFGPVNDTQSGNMNYHVLPIDTPCNAVAARWIFLKKYSYAIGGVTALIVFLAIVLCSVHVVRRKRTPGNMMNSEPPDPEYEYVDLRQVNDEMPCYSKCEY